MFYLPKQKNTLSHEAAIAAGASFSAEGQAAVRTSGATANGVSPATGGASDVFAGFVIVGTSAAPLAEPYYNKVETFLVPSTGTITLSLTPVSGQVSVLDVTAGSAVSSPSVSGANITGLTSAHTVTVTYKYSVTVQQSINLQGNVQPGGYAGAQVGQVGLITRGTVYTSEFDASVDWAAATAIKLKANGQLTDQSGSGNTVKGFVVDLPTEEIPFLGVEFDIL